MYFWRLQIANVKEFMPILRPAILPAICLIALLLLRCETDIDVIAPKRDMTIIYGLLEANQGRHYIRINKSFVGEQSASEMASVQGINEYSDSELQARIMELNAPGDATPVREWTLQSTYINSKESGAFNSDSNKVYYFDAQLDVGKYYRIECKVNINGEPEKTVTAITNVVGDRAADGGLEQLRLVRPRNSGNNSSNGGTERTKDEVVFITVGGYASDYKVEWSGTEDGARYTTYARLYYREIDPVSGSVIRNDSVTLPMGTKEVAPGSGNVTFEVNTQDIFATIGRKVPDYMATDNFVREVSDTLQFFVEVANDELSTYITISNPVTEVVQQKPEYTNVDNGIGIFASRLISSTRNTNPLLTGRIMDNRTMEELLYSNAPGSGNYTVAKNFTNNRCTVSSTGPDCD